MRGINSAATVWCSCAVGVFAGLGMIMWAGVVTALVVFTNVVLHHIERKIESTTK